MPRSRLLLLLVIAFIAAPGCGREQSKDAKGQPSPVAKADKAKDPEPANRQPDFIVTAAELLDEVIKDSKKADVKYQGKLVQVTGPVYEIEFRGKAITVLVADENLKKKGSERSIYAVLAGPSVAVGQQLSRKQNVKLTGTFKEANSLGYFTVLVNCRVEELSKSETIHVVASDAAKEFTDDAKAAGKKYDTKDVIITGEIAALTKGEFGTTYVKLKGNDKLQVSVFVGPDDVSFLKPGQTVKMRSSAPYAPSLDKTEVRFDKGSVVEAK